VIDRDRRDSEEIEFDFFDDAPTREASATEDAPRGPMRRRLPRRPGGGGTAPPVVRLAALIAGAIILAVVLVLWVNGCRNDQKVDAYTDYMADVDKVTSDSEQIGKQLNTLIATPGLKLQDLQDRLDGLRNQQAQVVTQAQGLDPPGTLREQQESLVDAMALRVSGLAGLAQAFSQITAASNATQAGKSLSEQSARFVASDVLYDDFFRIPSQVILRREGITGVDVPTSEFLTTPELATAASWELVVKRLTQTPGGGLHGNQIDGVRVLPGGKQLSPTEENTVEASERLAFEVAVRNSGDSQETQVEVTLTVQGGTQPIKRTQTIAIIDPGKTKSVVFRDLGTLPFGTRTTVRVNVLPVEGEQNTSNNTVEYPVIFSFG
jgi:CARDB protein